MVLKKSNAGSVQQLVQDAIAAIRHGHITRARALLVEATDRAPANAEAWLWRGAIAESAVGRRFCLERVLAVEPEHRVARRALELIPNSDAAEALANPWRARSRASRRSAASAPDQAACAGELPVLPWTPIGAAVELRAVYTEPPNGTEAEQPAATPAPAHPVLERFRGTLRPTRQIA